MSTKSNLIIGIATAAALGAAIGFLFAPERGTDLRKKVKQNANTWADELLSAIQKGKDHAQQLTNDAQGKEKSLKNKAKQEYEDLNEVVNKN